MSVSKNFPLLFAVLFCSSAFHFSNAQPQNFYFTNYGVKDGMSYGLVNDILRDKEGFLWIATFNGLNRFDGSNFKVFHSNPHDSSSIAASDILRVCEDHGGNIWCGTDKGVSRYNRSTGTFSNYHLTNPFGFTALANFVNEILCDRHGTIWCGTRAGIFEYDKMQDRFIGYYHDDNDAASPTNDHVYKNSFVEDPINDRIWFAGKKGINFIDTKTKLFYNYKNNPQHLPVFDSTFIYPLCVDAKQNLWYIRRSEAKITRYNLLTHTMSRDTLATDDKKRPLLFDVETIFVDSKQQQWLSTWTQPLFFKTPEDKLYHRFSHDEQVTYTINSDFFWDVTEDRDGTLWFGGLNGISKFQPSQQYYYLLKPNALLPATSKFHNIISIFQENHNTLWLGTDAGLYSFDAENLSCKKFTMKGIDISDSPFLSIAEKDSVLWLATFSGVKFFDLRTHLFTKKPGLPPELIKQNENISEIYTTANGDVWINDYTGKALFLFNNGKRRWLKFRYPAGDNQSISAGITSNIIEDDNSDIWLGTLQDGLIRYDKKNEQFDFVPTSITNNTQSPGTTPEQKTAEIRRICKGNRNELYLLSEELWQYNYNDNTVRTWRQADGITTHGSFAMIKDHYGNIWLVGDQHATVLSPVNNRVSRFRFDYPASNYRSSNASLCLLNGKVCIPIGDALAICDPDLVRHMKRVFSPVLISDFSVFEKSIPLPQNQAGIMLTYKQNFFSIAFSSFRTSADDLEYAYKLDGFDHDWIYTSREFASYTNVPGGTYTFLVKAGAHGLWSESTAMHITIIPPFWQTTWFKAFAILLSFGLIFFIVKLRERNIKRQQEQQLKLHIVRDKIARDLHDDVGASLSSIRMYSEAVRMQVKEKVPEADVILGKMSANAREIVENMSDIVWAINPQNDSLQFMEDRMRAFVSAVCNSKNITPHFNQIDFHELKLPMEMRKNIFLIFKEAVNNAAKYSGCKNLVMNLEKSEDKLKLTIDDDGTGFDETRVTFGNGLTSMKKRAEEIGGDLCIYSKAGEGTSIVLTIPIATGLTDFLPV